MTPAALLAAISAEQGLVEKGHIAAVETLVSAESSAADLRIGEKTYCFVKPAKVTGCAAS